MLSLSTRPTIGPPFYFWLACRPEVFRSDIAKSSGTSTRKEKKKKGKKRKEKENKRKNVRYINLTIICETKNEHARATTTKNQISKTYKLKAKEKKKKIENIRIWEKCRTGVKKKIKEPLLRKLQLFCKTKNTRMRKKIKSWIRIHRKRKKRKHANLIKMSDWRKKKIRIFVIWTLQLFVKKKKKQARA